MIGTARRVVLAALLLAAVVVPTLLALARYPRWWEWIAPEQTPMTWFQSVVLVVAAVVSGLAWYVSRLTARRPRLGFALLAVGFAALAFDERFAIHERVRDGYLAPRDVRLPLLTWVGPGDFLILALALVGLALLPLVLRSLGRDRQALTHLVVGVLLAVIAVGMDSIDPSTWSVEAERVQQTLEECIEFWAGLNFLGAVTVSLLALLGGLTTPAPAVEAEVAHASPSGRRSASSPLTPAVFLERNRRLGPTDSGGATERVT